VALAWRGDIFVVALCARCKLQHPLTPASNGTLTNTPSAMKSWTGQDSTVVLARPRRLPVRRVLSTALVTLVILAAIDMIVPDWKGWRCPFSWTSLAESSSVEKATKPFNWAQVRVHRGCQLPNALVSPTDPVVDRAEGSSGVPCLPRWVPVRKATTASRLLQRNVPQHAGQHCHCKACCQSPRG